MKKRIISGSKTLIAIFGFISIVAVTFLNKKHPADIGVSSNAQLHLSVFRDCKLNCVKVQKNVEL